MSVSKFTDSNFDATRGKYRLRVVSLKDDYDHPYTRLAVTKVGEGNANRTDGVSGYFLGLRELFFKFIKPNELSDIADILVNVSSEQLVAFTVDDELTEKEGQGAVVYYKFALLRSKIQA